MQQKHSISTTQGQLSIVELRAPFERLEIQFMPEAIKKSRTAEISPVGVVGRNHPHYQLTGGEDRLSFKLDFHAEEESRADVIRKVRWLESLTYNDGYSGPARNVRIVWGQLFRKEIWIVKSVSSDLQQFMPNAGMLPQQAYVEIELALDPKTNLRIRDVRR